ncbi:Uncharacterized protein BM_BM17400 [Brugia malayi]|uniref:Uncharacterized protein n=1 Tax=Brugia malayi TaxID=6279 RepID=A0A4E9F7K4_BRUMA|nr:Uncharacterized protein BM_BM17400 [Brugia malayi]VIO92006.1 Uncharacterized protein BM_BM17400 [Brugia malayi]
MKILKVLATSIITLLQGIHSIITGTKAKGPRRSLSFGENEEKLMITWANDSKNKSDNNIDNNNNNIVHRTRMLTSYHAFTIG